MSPSARFFEMSRARSSKGGDEVGEPLRKLLAATELRGVVEVRQTLYQKGNRME